MHVTVNHDLQSRGNIFPDEVEFSVRLNASTSLVPFRECHCPQIMIVSIHISSLGISLIILEEENRSLKDTFCYSDVKI